MQRLYAPWRSPYLQDLSRDHDCVFCAIQQNPHLDSQHHVLHRDSRCFVVMNAYPYNPGHFMVIPNTHVDSPEQLSLEVWQHLQMRIYQGVQLLYAFGAQGINLGFNLKDVGGAGISAHLHGHLVPRFAKDVNFMSVIGETRVYGVDFEAIYADLKSKSADYFKE
ncbi:HIT family protein [Helicobacter bizzozeronii]|uniref:HIT family protein n=1 Tax=Helicobacter bizzozeronii TaxID=56877 RepID=UPI000CEE4341|nr:HIT domain-containing protein [Helicobacter bizzozeronii]